MTVDELIRLLENMPAEADVWVQCPANYDADQAFPLTGLALDDTGDVFLEG